MTDNCVKNIVSAIITAIVCVIFSVAALGLKYYPDIAVPILIPISILMMFFGIRNSLEDTTDRKDKTE